VNPVTGTGCTNVDIGVNAVLELVDKFCYLGDMLSVDGDTNASVETRIRIGWNKLRQLIPFLTNRYQQGKTRKIKTNLDFLEQEIVSGSGIC